MNAKLSDKNTPPSEMKWIQYTLAMIENSKKYDIEISEENWIRVGEFDIEL
jgi:hypothetical protein